MKNSNKKILAVIIAAALSSTTIFAGTGNKINFNTKDIENHNITEAIFADAKLTMVNVWATFCGPCISEMPDLAKLNAEYQNKGFQVVGIVLDAVNRRGNPDASMITQAKKIVSQTGADYTHIVPDSTLLNGVLSDVYAVPTTFFVDSQGNIVGQTYMGSKSYSQWKTIIDSLLK